MKQVSLQQQHLFQLQIPFSADIQFLAGISVGLIEYEVWWLKKVCAWRYVG